MKVQSSYKNLILGLLAGVIITTPIYFFFPPPQEVQAGQCNEDYIIQRILFCIDGGTISSGSFSTYCNS